MLRRLLLLSLPLILTVFVGVTSNSLADTTSGSSEKFGCEKMASGGSCGMMSSGCGSESACGEKCMESCKSEMCCGANCACCNDCGSKKESSRTSLKERLLKGYRTALKDQKCSDCACSCGCCDECKDGSDCEKMGKCGDMGKCGTMSQAQGNCESTCKGECEKPCNDACKCN